MSRTLRYLAGAREWHPYLAAGRPLPAAASWSLGARAEPALDALGAEYVPSRAGAIKRDDGADLAVSLLSEAVSERHAGVILPHSPPKAASRPRASPPG